MSLVRIVGPVLDLSLADPGPKPARGIVKVGLLVEVDGLGCYIGPACKGLGVGAVHS